MMKSNFLNLPSSASGDARRHVPFRSIIHKPFSIIFVLVFVFSILFSYVHPVAALADPVFQPVYDTQFYQLPQFVDPLNSTQQDIFYFILGSQVVEYAGLSDYQVENPYQDPSSVGEWFKKIGIDLYNDVLESFAIAGAPVIAGAKWLKDLYANIAGAANFAGAFNNSSWSDWYNDVQTNGLSLKLYPSMFGALNQYFAFNNGIYNWQFSDLQFQTTNFVWGQRSMSDSNQLLYNGLVSSLPDPKYFATSLYYLQYGMFQNEQSPSNIIISFTNRFDMFINSTANTVELIRKGSYEDPLYVEYSYYQGSNKPHSDTAVGVYRNTINFSNLDLASYSDVVQYYLNYHGSNPLIEIQTSYGTCMPRLSDIIDNYLVGPSYENSVPVIAISDLNFGQNNNQDTLAPIIDTLLDIKGLINDILEQNELKQPALDNLTDLNGDPLPATQLQPVSVAVELPDSGITINSGLFTPLTKNGGYINYLWYMTKPLVQYTSDLVQTLVFPDDTGEGFDAIGPGVIVFGVISLGLIGGLVVKCLL